MVRRSILFVTLLLLTCGLFIGCGDEGVTTTPDTGDQPTDTTVTGDVSSDTHGGECADQSDGEPCDDQDPCTLDDVCAGGVCVGGSNDPCSSDNPCEVGACISGEGCKYEALDDGSACDASCFEVATCQAGECKVDPESAVKCPEPDPLTQSCVAELACDASTGECTKEIYLPADTVCDTDSNLCTIETCNAEGTCVNGGESVSCSDKASEDPCQTWACDKKDGVCDPIGFAGEVSCNDGNGCTLNDTCFQDEFSFIACKGTPVVVDDSNPCTDDSCVDGEILHSPVNGLPCETGDECTPSGLCQDSVCEFEGCPCYEDEDCPAPENKCLGEMFCDTSEETPSCQLKEGTAVLCDAPASPCFTATCVPESGECALAPAEFGTACNDNNACTTQDVCDGEGECNAGPELSCDNGAFCDGPEGCDPTSGCLVGNPPALSDGVACTIDTCNEDTDSIDHVGDPALCEDGDACNGAEICDVTEGCQAGEALECDDGAYCNGSEGCDPASGCTAGDPPTQDDAFECTVEVCDEETDSIESVPTDALCIPPDGLCIVGVCDPAAGGCSTAPKFNCCGNGIVEAGEECDDGDAEEGDGCFGCVVEEDWTCDGSPSLCQTCGDGIQQGNEVCDAGVNNGCQSCKKDCSGPVEVYPGNVVIKDQAKMDSLAGYSVIDGNLSIEFYKDGEITLPELECVKGYMQILYTDTTHLDGLSNVGYVGGYLKAQSNSKLKNVDGLSEIDHVETLVIQDNDALLELDGLQGLKTIDKALTISGNKTLESIAGLKNVASTLSGDLILTYNDALLTLTGLQGIDETQKLTVTGNKMLSNLSGLALNKVASVIRVSGNDSLSTVLGLESLTKLHWELYIEDNPQLLHIDALSNVVGTTGSRIRIVNNPKLENIDGLSGITKINTELYLADLPKLENLEGVANVSQIEGQLTIQKCNSLTDLSDMQALTSAGAMRIQYNTGLIQLGFPQYGDEIDGSLYIVSNTNLESISSLSLVEEIQGGLSIGKNHALPTLTGLDKVQELGGILHIFDNGSLEDLTGLGSLEKVSSQMTISQNGELKTLLGLGKLSSVGGNLTIEQNPSLIHFDSLEGLKSVAGGLDIGENDDLTNINGLSKLTSLGNTIYVDNNAELENVDGLSGLTGNNGKSIFIRYNDELLHVDGLQNFKGTFQAVELTGNKDLQSVSGLGGIASIAGGFIVKGTDELEDFTGLDKLQSVGYLVLESNEAIKNLEGLAGLKSVGDIFVKNNLSLQNLDGLNSLSGAIDVLTLQDNPSLEHIAALGSVNSCKSIIVINSTNLSDLSGLDNLEHISGSGGIVLRLFDNVNLKNVDALSNVTLDEIKGELRIDTNISLENLDGLAGFQGNIAGALWVAKNSALTDVSGLSGITKASSIKFQDNTLLDQCHIKQVMEGVEFNSYCVKLNAVSACPDDC